MRNFAGQVALVTGGSRGVGRAIALELSRQGAQVLVVGRDAAALRETVVASGERAPITSFPIDLTAVKASSLFFSMSSRRLAGSTFLFTPPA